jgi:CRISPR-associated endonuclease/helicase Cas3
MYNFYKSVEELITGCPPIQSYLKDAGNFLAHRPRNEYGNSKPETLPEHIELVNSYCTKLVNIHHLDGIIDGLIKS